MEPPETPQPPPDGGRRSSVPGPFRYGCATAVTVVLSLFLCCGLTLTRCAAGSLGSSPSVVPSPSPGPFAGSVVLTTDGTILLYANPDGARCRDRLVVPVDQTDRVVLRTMYLDLSFADCVRRRNAPPVTSVLLPAPLAGRSIVDEMTGDPVPYFDERTALHPTLPIPGWWTTQNAPYGEVRAAAADFGGPGSAVLAETFLRLDQKTSQPTGDVLWVIEVTGGGWRPPAGTATTPVTVRGRHGRAGDGIVVWTEGDRTYAVRADTYPRPLPRTEQLVAIAEALVPGEAR
jgi:hypothetical protein